MKVAFVNPPQKYLVHPKFYPPTGLGYLVSCVKKWASDIVDECVLLDLAGHTEDEAFSEIQGYDIVGYSAVSSYWNDTVSLARRNTGNAYQIVGGPHPSITGETDVCFGSTFIRESEKSIVSFLRDYTSGRPKSIYEPEPVAIDEIPYPECDAGGRLNYKGNDKTAVIFTGRGCTHNCSFCAARAMYKKIKFRSIENVMGEVDNWIAKGITEIRFMDDAFTMSRPRTREICEAIKPRGIRWSCMIRADQVDSELLRMMKDSGCVEVAPGIESFDQNVLDAYEKFSNVMENTAIIHECYEEGLNVHVFLLVSGPGETYKRTPDLNIEALERLKNKYQKMLFSVLMPHPGTAIYNNPAKYGVKIVENDCAKYFQHSVQRIDGKPKILDPWFPLRVLSMTEEQQMENLIRTRDYVLPLKQLPKGGASETVSWSKANKA